MTGDVLFIFCPASWNVEGRDGASAGRHASGRSAVRLLPEETSEYLVLHEPAPLSVHSFSLTAVFLPIPQHTLSF